MQARRSNRLASIARELKASVSTDWRTQGPYQWGTIAVVHSTTPFNTCDVYLDSSSGTAALNIPYLNGYSPTVGDIVLIGRMAGAARTQRVILGPLEQPLQGFRLNGTLDLAGPINAPPSLGGTVAPTSFGTVPIKIAEATPSGVNSFTLASSIPSGFRDLAIEYVARCSDAAAFAELGMRFNTDTGANYGYTRHSLGSGYAAQSQGVTWQTSGRDWFVSANTASSGWPGFGRIWIPSYAGTTFNKVAKIDWSYWALTGGLAANAIEDDVANIFWNSAVAINQIDILDITGGNFVSGSIFVLYGIP